MRRALISAAAVIIAIVAQLAVVNRLTLPGGAPPDVVLLVVIGLALSGGPAAGALTGFWAGLGLDLAPPGSPLIGEYALVLCLVGYGCGCARGLLGRPVRVTPVSVAAGIIAAAAGEALATAISLALSPGQASWAVVRQLLPATIFADAALGLLVIPLMLLAGRLADGPVPVPDAARPAPAQVRERQQATAGGLAGRRRRALPGAGALRAGWLGRPEPPRRPPAPRVPSGAPWLRTASGRRLTAGASAGTARPPLPGREPRLRLGRGHAGLVPRQAGPARRPALPRLSFTVPRRRWRGSAASPAAGRPPAAAPRFGQGQRARLRRALRAHSRAAQLAGYGAAGAGRPALRPTGFSPAPPPRAGAAASGQARRMLPAQLTVPRRAGPAPAVPSGRRMFRQSGRAATRPRGPRRRGAVARLRGGRRPLLPRWVGRLRRDRASGWTGRGRAGHRTGGPR